MRFDVKWTLDSKELGKELLFWLPELGHTVKIGGVRTKVVDVEWPLNELSDRGQRVNIYLETTEK